MRVRWVGVLFLALLVAGQAQAQTQTRYVTDRTQVELRRGPSTEYRIVRYLEAGDRVEVGAPAETILRVAGEETCDVILLSEAPVGNLRRWLCKVTGLLVATVATHVAQLAAIPVVVVK